MITVYYRKTCSSSRRAVEWMKEHQIDYQLYRVEQISKEEILNILSLSENGLDDLVKLQGSAETLKKIKVLYSMCLNDAISYLKLHPEVLKTPIMFTRKKLLIGYHEAEIRQFVPRSKRLRKINLGVA